jgi:hypothetical protein
MRDYLNVHSNRWDGIEIFNIPCNGRGEQFEGGSRYVCFDGGLLVGEFKSSTEAEKGFLNKGRVVDGINKRDYLGIDEKLRTYQWRQ